MTRASELNYLPKPLWNRQSSQPLLDVVNALLVLWSQEFGEIVDVVCKMVGCPQGLAVDSPQRLMLAAIHHQLHGPQPKYHSSVTVFKHVKPEFGQHLLKVNERPPGREPCRPKAVTLGSLLKLARSPGLKERGAARHHAHDS